MNNRDKAGFDSKTSIRGSGAVDPSAAALYGGRACGLREARQLMTTFDKREDAFEKMYAHDEELRFKANARRNKRLGPWGAEKLGIAAVEAGAYAQSVVIAG